ncbi:ankyrin repeat domain-containing protein [Acholeplasma vituli]|uniref:Ankyrin repeat domain-containing protein n=1 Tax=Paracholeplasma vituli TaxID=69473 RepID=A0ABT2PXV7_9MOLU|nr:ankyrin repeat domain-containing protein [Paracholeplasma vituli]MCU0104552.1 ankyrin repeat domain-containing protein [Paracholeplasma vituli]
MQEAAAVGNYNAVVALVEAGANVIFINSITKRTPLIDALESYEVNRFLIANYLVDQGADVHHSITKHGIGNALAESIFYYGVSMKESYDFFQRMISLDGNPYIYVSPGNILLKSAFEKHKLVMVYLLENDLFDVNVVNKAGFSALMFLARFTIDELNIEMVNILLEYDADKTLVNEDGMTAYDYALETGNPKLIELLRFE